jgi:mono/diheme cytochrome c family protein
MITNIAQRSLAMKNVCILFALVMLVAAPLSLLSAENGAALYKSKCAMCHGEKGEGKTAPMKAPALKGTQMAADKLVEYIIKGEAGKTYHANPVSGVNEEQAKALADFINGLK